MDNDGIEKHRYIFVDEHTHEPGTQAPGRAAAQHQQQDNEEFLQGQYVCFTSVTFTQPRVSTNGVVIVFRMRIVFLSICQTWEFLF
jgi:hypothetical protein